MNRIIHTTIAVAFGFGFAACGGGETGQEMETDAAAVDTVPETGAMGGQAGRTGGQLSTPGWYRVDHDARTVTLEITAGQTDANNRWNFNGYASGNATVVVPQGYEVTVNFRNADPANPHSVAVDSRTGPNWPATFEDPTPAFEGATTTGAASMTDSTQPNESETISFTASQAGRYSLVCYVPAHAATGMWIGFEVSADGQAGVRTP